MNHSGKYALVFDSETPLRPGDAITGVFVDKFGVKFDFSNVTANVDRTVTTGYSPALARYAQHIVYITAYPPIVEDVPPIDELREALFRLPSGIHTFASLYKVLPFTGSMYAFGARLRGLRGAEHEGRRFAIEGKNRHRTYIITPAPKKPKPTKFVLPPGIVLKRGSKAKLDKALRSLRGFPSDGPTRDLGKPAIVVLGAPRSGKTTLLKALIEHFYCKHSDQAVCRCFPGSEDSLQCAIPGFLSRPYVWFDDVPARAVRSNTLQCFIAARVWGYRRFHSQDQVETPVSTRVFLSSCDLPICPDFERRAIVIELEGGAL